MPPSHKVELGRRVFPSKTVAKSYISTEILHSYPVGQAIDEPEHIEVLVDILRRKANAQEKIGSGIDYFYVDHTSKFRDYVSPEALTIVIHHQSPDEDDVDFGYSKIIDESTEVDYAKEALRFSILDKRDAFKFSHFSNGAHPLDSDGVAMSSHDESEVRYANPDWGTLTANFAETVGGWDQIETHSGDGVAPQVGRRLVSRTVESQWRDYYDSHASPILSRKRGT